ncbi:hybrid sensor histidine kinase/response regulator (plasmid) [Tundrisphaera lichenicola]|uniref:hybrid sensor histidine kinase/response regulator n=1 Tax=Tundrisphaera lichenicola TaxID=2029860 RepID=UPI003EBCCFA9
MSDDLSGFSLMDLFRSEADGQTALLSEGLMALERVDTPSASALESLMRAAHSLKGAARIVGLDAAVRVAHALEDNFVAAQRGQFAIRTGHVDVLLRAVDQLVEISQLPENEVVTWQEANESRVAETVSRLERLRTESGEAPIEAGSTEEPSSPSPLPIEDHSPLSPTLSHDGGGGQKSGPIVDQTTPSEPPPPSPPEPPHPSPPEPGQQAPPSPEASGRVVRVSADSLSRLMGLAGESLVQARQLRPFFEGLMALRNRQGAVIEALQALEDPRASDPSVAAELLARARAEAGRCIERLGQQIESFDDYARRGEDLAGRLHHEVLASRMRPMSEGVRGFPRMVREVARDLGKRVKFEVRGDTTGVDRDILDKLEAPLNHLIRNAMDHAIELPEVRAAVGKDPVGLIRLEARHSAGMLQITLTDDGQGVDVARLRAKIVERGLATEEMVGRLSEAELLEFLFLPGFSTKEAVTEISGRGVGLDVVQEMVKTVGGVVRVSSKAGQGTRFTLHLPITMSVIRALLVRISGEPYAFPLNRIDRIVRVPRDEIRRLEGRPHFLLDDQLVGLVDAVQVLDLPESGEAADPMPVVVVSDRNHRFGMIVEAFLGERDLDVRPLDPRLGHPPDINSASVLDDGWPVLIVDVEDLVRSIDNLLGDRRLKSSAGSSSIASKARRPIKRILVVDDSITVRELERQLLEGRGYAVDVAVDGVDGWNAVRVGDYHLVISDVDMPRMDGIGLVRSIKQDPRLRSTPVVIVSYKDREEDRTRGLDAGADGYLTKSSFHDRTFLDAVADLIGEA